MMSSIEFTPQALKDLQLLYNYISMNWGEKVSKKIIQKITSEIRRLEEYPLLGVNFGKIIDEPTDYRFLFAEKNYIFYRLDLNRVQIVRILSEKRDYIQQLFETDLKSDNEK